MEHKRNYSARNSPCGGSLKLADLDYGTGGKPRPGFRIRSWCTSGSRVGGEHTYPSETLRGAWSAALSVGDPYGSLSFGVAICGAAEKQLGSSALGGGRSLLALEDPKAFGSKTRSAALGPLDGRPRAE